MIRINAISLSKLVAALVAGPCTYAELEEETGLHVVTLRRYVKAFRREGLLHIGGWEKDPRGRDQIAIFKWGSGSDKRRSKITGAERARRYRENLRKRAAGLGGKRPWKHTSLHVQGLS